MKKKDPMWKDPNKESHWKDVHGAAKLRYLFDYYNLPLILAAIVIYIVVWNVVRHNTKQDYGLYVALVNVVPSDELTSELEHLLPASEDPSGQEAPAASLPVCLYRGLFLTTDTDSSYHQYSYASRIKILGAIDSEKLDLVLMDKEAFDAFSQNGYLADLRELDTGREMPDALAAAFVENIYIEEDNSAEVALGTAKEYESVTRKGMYGLDLTRSSALFSESSLSGTVYLGIVENSPRKEDAVRYLQELASYKSAGSR